MPDLMGALTCPVGGTYLTVWGYPDFLGATALAGNLLPIRSSGD